MTDHEQRMFNASILQNQAYEWRDHTVSRLNRKLEPLGAHDKIVLLRKIDKLL